VRLVLASGLHRVVIPVLVEPASQDWLSYGTLATLLFALGLSVAVGRRRNENAIALEAAAAGLKTEASLLAGAIGRLSKMTSARPVDTIPQPSPSLSRSPSLAAPPDAPSRRVSPLAGSAGALFKAVRDWRTLNAFGSPEVERALQELQDLREEIAGGLNETDAKARLERCGTVLAQLTLAITDEQSDPQRPNHMLEEAMMAILQAAGLKPLSPRDGDPYDPKQHHMMGPGIESGPNKRRNSVARVARRGLIRGANTIQLAEVQLYN